MSDVDHSHSHSDPDHSHHDHTHGTIDPALLTTERGIWAVKWSLIGLAATAVFQVVIVFFSGSVALLADTIHNIADAATAIPLWIAFTLARRQPSRRFTYGYGRVEDVAGVMIVLTILFSAVLAGYESINRLLHPQPVEHLWAVAIASIIGFAGNELVAIFRIRVGKEINSAALVADGYHARVDGLTSLGVLFSAVGVWLGYPLADPIFGLLITIRYTAYCLGIRKSCVYPLAGRSGSRSDRRNHARDQPHSRSSRRYGSAAALVGPSFTRRSQSCCEVPNCRSPKDTRLQWKPGINSYISLPYLSNVTIHIDPEDLSGEEHHRIKEHTHEGLAVHSHR